MKFHVSRYPDAPVVLDEWAQPGTEIVVERNGKRLRVLIQEDGFHVAVGDFEDEPCLKVVE